MRWERCIYHRLDDAEAFVTDYFSNPNRKTLIIAGAGFDPRSVRIATLLAKSVKGTLKGLFLREERPGPAAHLVKAGNVNASALNKIVPSCGIHSFDVIDSTDNAPKGGRAVAKLLNELNSFDDVTDIVLDCTALSVGVFFVVARHCDDYATASGINFHLFVHDDPSTDSAIAATLCEQATPLHTFKGMWKTEASASAAKLWIPQFGRNQAISLDMIYNTLRPDAVCPVLPFPAGHPRYADTLIEEYAERIQELWNIDVRDIVYAHESNPVDLYRTLLRMDDTRTQVFSSTVGSHITLSPLGSKALSVGMLMASLERDFTVFSVEALGYHVNEATLAALETNRGEMIHIWLTGEAYA